MSREAQNRGALSSTIYTKALKTIQGTFSINLHLLFFSKTMPSSLLKLCNITVSFPTSKQCPDIFQIEQLALAAISFYEKNY